MDEKLLEDIIAKLLPSDAIQKAINHAVREKMDDCFKRTIRDEVKRITRELGSDYIRKKIDDVIAAPVLIDDGWGSKEEYGSFDDLIRRRMNDVFQKGQWDFQNTLRKTVDEKIKRYCEQVIAKHKKDDYMDETLELIYKDLKGV